LIVQCWLVTNTTSLFPNLERCPELQPVLAMRGDSIRAIVSELRAAEKTKDRPRCPALAEFHAAV